MQATRALLLALIAAFGGSKKTPFYSEGDLPYFRPEYGPKFYHSWEMINEEMKTLRGDPSKTHFVDVHEEAWSVDNNPLWRVVYTNKVVKGPKIKALLLYGVHAREPISTESYFWLHKNLTESMAQPPSTTAGRWGRYVLDNMELHTIPIINPDGLIYMIENKEYCWRWNKNGVDLNRNFDWHFGGPGSTNRPGTEEWHGHKAFSEPEAAYVRDLLKAHNYTFFLDVHSGEQQLFTAFVDTVSNRNKATRPPMIVEGRQMTRPQTDEELDFLKQIVKDSARPVRPDRAPGSYFKKSGIAWKYNSYGADGTTFDYAAGVAKVPYSICVEAYGVELLRGNIDCFVEFNPPNEHLQETLDEISVLYWSGFPYLIEKFHDVSLTDYDPEKTISRSLGETEARLSRLMDRLGSASAYFEKPG